ncbi:MAG: nitroreductase family protein [Acidobacteriota bacterium]
MKATTDYPVHELISRRWSPYGFSDRPVPETDLRSLFEAARWAASSYNEQPWSYLVAVQQEREEFDRMLSCLVEGNQGWAKGVPVLAISVTRLNFVRNDKPNAAAIHDLGLAAATLTFEATARGLCVHQMIGILPDRAKEIFQIPEGHQAVTGLAIGYAADPDSVPEALRQRDLAPRARKPLTEFVFSSRWGNVSGLVTGAGNGSDRE